MEEKKMQELNLDAMEQVTGGELTQAQKNMILGHIGAAKKGGTIRHLLALYQNWPEALQFIKENI